MRSQFQFQLRSLSFHSLITNLALLVLAALLLIIADVRAQAGSQKTWTATQLAVVEGFDVPECLAFDAARNVVFVSNISAKEGEYWSDDGKGFISLLSADGKVRQMRWLDSTTAQPIHAPKGMCVAGNWLYFTDNSRLMRCEIVEGRSRKNLTPGRLEQIALPGAKKLNDLATDGQTVLVSDTETGKIFHVDAAGKAREIPSPAVVNGVTFHKGRMFAVSWSEHEVYELDPAGKNPPQAFGVASHFTNLDAIEVLDDGTFIVSDFKGNKVSTIAPDRKTVRTLVEVETPADVGLDRKRGILYVPLFIKNKSVLFQLKQQ